MDILGIGTWELVAIILVMLVVAGPKRMIAWSYQLGKYVSVLRSMWSDAAKSIQREFDQAGVDIQVPKDLPTRAALTKEVGRFVQNAGQPLRDPLQEVNSELKDVRDSLRTAPENGAAIGRPPRTYAPSLPPHPASSTAQESDAVNAVEPPAPAASPAHRLAEMGRNGSANGSSNGADHRPADAPAGESANSFGTWGG